MSREAKLIGLVTMLAVSAQAYAADWQLEPAEGSRGLLLTFRSDEAVGYRFECEADDVMVTQTGVTKLLDVTSGSVVGDDAAATMPAGAAMMAVFVGKGDPRFVPAEAIKNPAGGWDLTIRLPKTDKQLKAVAKSDMLSLFTTGYTIAVPMDGAGRGQWSDFLQACNAQAEPPQDVRTDGKR